MISSEEAVDNYIYLYDGNRVDQLAYNRRGEKGFLLQYNFAAGDFVKSASSDKAGIVNASVSGNTIALEAGKKTGTANVKITLGSGLTRSFKVKVSRKAVTTRKISVASRSVRLKKGKTFDLQTKLSPVTTSQTKIRYKTSNKKIAAVSSRGVIKAKAEGNAVITVKNGSKTVKVQVTVSK